MAALITGASSGIGAAFAREFARRGHPLVLVARREALLRALAETLAVPAHVVPLDLADPQAPGALLRHLEAEGIAVDALVNNAGFGVPGPLVAADWARHRATLEVMTAAPVHLAWALAPGMAARGHGLIVNVASLSALLPPHAGGTLYYPVKSFLLQFSLALRAEMRGTGVHVSALCPGFTETGFQEAAGGTVESVAFPRALWSRPEDVARRGVAGVLRNEAVIIPGLVNKAIAVAFRLMPPALGRRIVGG